VHECGFEGPASRHALQRSCCWHRRARRILRRCSCRDGPRAAGTRHRRDLSATYPDTPAPRLTPDLVLTTIRDRYLSGVERCYSRHAKALGSSANGRVVLSFTVDEDGKTREGSAQGITKRVDRCITAQVARWTFPAPRKESAFSLGLQLSTN
jgi:hypothetical protein